MKRKIIRYALLLTAVLLDALPTAAQQTYYPDEIGIPIQYDTSLPLSVILQSTPPQQFPSGPEQEMPTHSIPENVPQQPQALGYDPVVQSLMGTSSALASTVNFDGINNLCNCRPPDANGDVSSNYYFQTVNRHFAIYDKSGVALLGPYHLDSLWSGFHGEWDSLSLSKTDPVVLYDHLADRWVVSLVAYRPLGTFSYLLLAVSQASNPLGSWHRYAYQSQVNVLIDYPKIAVWPDAYYVTANRFNGTVFAGMAAYALERDSLLVGRPGRYVMRQSFTDALAGRGLLPSELDGATVPPANTPNYFAYVIDGETQGGTDRLGIYEFRVNWMTPTASTFTGPTYLYPALFNRMCVSDTSRNCVPQLGSTEGLDLIGNRLMHRLQYRNFGSYQTLVTNHSVDAGSTRAGVRWYELRNTGSGWNIYQQGTFAPADGLYRWMGSIAMDKYGNIALGYSVSSSSIYPAIRYTGRRASDPLGQMTIAEGVIMSGGGSQLDSRNRWGDYSMMAVDPTDDATFWFTSEYYQTSSQMGWRTRVASFQIPVSVVIDQHRGDGSRLSGTTVGRWTGASFFNLNITANPETISTTVGSREILKGFQGIVDNQKYRVWRRGPEDQLDSVQNHRGFTIRPDDQNFTSRFNPTETGIIIRNELIGAPNVNGGNIEFMDPWLVDTTDATFYQSPYGYRNLGMSAPFKQEPSLPFRPDTSSKYKGVFLNQSGPPSWPPPYYSVRASLVQNIGGIYSHFDSWQGTGVTLTQIGTSAGYDQKAVVFTSANAIVKAKYKADSASISSPIIHRWNMVSVPDTVANFAKSAIYQTAISDAFTYEAGYVQKDTLHVGGGYWVKFDSTISNVMTYRGRPVFIDTISVAAGWNMIGSITVPVSVKRIKYIPSGIAQSNYQTYNSGAYYVADTIKPGKAYWFKAASAGKIVLDASADTNTIILPAGQTPPPPPSGDGPVATTMFGILADTVNGIRHPKILWNPATDPNLDHYVLYRYVCIYDVCNCDGTQPQFVATLPSNVLWYTDMAYEIFTKTAQHTSPNVCVHYYVIAEDKFHQRTRSSNEALLYANSNNEVEPPPAIDKRATGQTPLTYGLSTCFPNPFNPITTISYAVPEDIHVSLKIYDVLGREVATLVDEFKYADWYKATFDASMLPSGVYFYKLTAGKFTDVKKMLLAK